MKKTGRFELDRYEEAVVILTEYLFITGIAVSATLIFMVTGGGNNIPLLSFGYAEMESGSVNLALTKLIPATGAVLGSTYDILLIDARNCQVIIEEENNKTVLTLNCKGDERNIEIFNEDSLEISHITGDERVRITTGKAFSP